MFARLTIPVLGTLLLLAFASDAAACSTKLNVGWYEWKPYQEKLGDTFIGLDDLLLQAVMKRARCSYEYVITPWDKQIELVRDGDLDMAMAASRTRDRSSFAEWSVPYRRETMALFGRTGELDGIKSFADVESRRLTIAVLRGAYYGREFDRIQKKLSLLDVTRAEQQFKIVNASRADAALTDYYNGLMIIKKLKMGDRIVPHREFFVNRNFVHFLFSKNSVRRSDITKINQAIVELKANGQLRKILKNFY